MKEIDSQSEEPMIVELSQTIRANQSNPLKVGDGTGEAMVGWTGQVPQLSCDSSFCR